MPGLFEDASFPPYNPNDDTDYILGKRLRNKLSNAGILNKIKWVRLAEIMAQRCLDPTLEELCVLGTELYAEDARQAGVLGNCWLMSTLACMAEHAPELIRACFSKAPGTVLVDKVALAEGGKYEVQLMDPHSHKPMVVEIDDRLPCLQDSSGKFRPLFADCQSAVWALLLEKAFAKLCGTYSDLENKAPLWALEVIAGEANRGAQIYIKTKDQDVWQRHTLPSVKAGDALSQGSTRPGQAVPVTGAEPYTTAKMFNVLCDRWRIGNEHLVIAVADTAPLVDTVTSQGAKHAFTVVRVHSSTVQPGLVLLQLHNPWGKEERWKGQWSDSSGDWEAYPQVAVEVNWNVQNKSGKGYFWMQLEDFAAHFDSLHAVRRDFSNLQVTGVFPGNMPKWTIGFWRNHFAQQERVSWSGFKRACEAQTKECRSVWDKVVGEQAQIHGGRAGATFMEDVLKVALVSSSDGAITPIALYLLQARYSKTYTPPQCMAELLQQLLDSSNLPGLFQAQLEQELRQLRTVLRVPAEVGVQSSTCVAFRGQALDPRGWLLQRYDDWLAQNSCSRLLLLLAPASGGKSVFAATLAAARSDSVQAIHFFSPSQEGSVKAMLCSIAVQLAQQLPALRNNLLGQLRRGELSVDNTDADTADGLFGRLLHGPLGAVQPDAACRPVVVVIDALDASNRNDHWCPEALSMLDKFQALPAWLRVVATSRPEPYVLAGSHQARICAPNLGCLNPSYIYADDSHHLEDLATYIERTLIDRGFPRGEGLATATAVLLQHNVPRFRLRGYKDVLLPSEADLTAAAAAAAPAEDILQYLPGCPDHQHDAEFYMWPEEQYRQLLEALHLRADTQANSSKLCAARKQTLLLHGMFGLGKTTLAQHIRVVAEGVGRKVVWVSCGTMTDGHQCCEAIIEQFDETRTIRKDFKKITDQSLMRKLLCRHYDTLIILDDVWQHGALAAKSVIEQALAVGGAVQVLITSRFRLDELTVCQRILLDSSSMTTPGPNGHSLAGTVLLERTLGGQVQLPLQQQQQTSSSNCASGVAYYEQCLKDNAEWRKIIQHILDSCDGCMLAVAMIAAQLRNSGNVHELTEWQDVAEGLRGLIESKPAPANTADDEEGQRQRRTIFSAASMSIAVLKKAAGSSYKTHIACLQAMSLFPSGAMVQLPYCFPVYCALMGAAASDPDRAEGALRAALKMLCNHSLVFEDRTGYRMHDIMAEFLQSENCYNTKVDMVALRGDEPSANNPPAGLSAAVVVALSGRQQCRKHALAALNILRKHEAYLAAITVVGYQNSPQQLLLPPGRRMAYGSIIDACCKRLLAALVLGKPLALAQAAMELVNYAATEQDATMKQHLMRRLERACKGVLSESVVEPPDGDWQVDGDAAAVQTHVLQAMRAAAPDIQKLLLVVLRMLNEMTAGAGAGNTMAAMLDAVAWVPERIGVARALLLPWRRGNPHAEVNSIFEQLWELSLSPLLGAVSMRSWWAMVELLVDAMKTFPLCDDDWAAQGDTSAPGSPVNGNPGWTMLQAEGLLAQLLRTIVFEERLHPFAPTVFDKMMEAVPYLASVMDDGWMHQLRCPQVILWVAHSLEHARVLARNDALLEALRSIRARGEVMGESEDKHIITNIVPPALELIEEAAGGADAGVGGAVAGAGGAAATAFKKRKE